MKIEVDVSDELVEVWDKHIAAMREEGEPGLTREQDVQNAIAEHVSLWYDTRTKAEDDILKDSSTEPTWEMSEDVDSDVEREVK